MLQPMYDGVVERYSVVPSACWSMAGSFSKKEDITHAESRGTSVYTPLYAEGKQLTAGKDPYAPRSHRVRMGTAAGRQNTKSTGIAEFPNADCRNRGLTQFRVRGLLKAKAQALWHVLAFNLLRMLNLQCPERGQSYLEVVMGS